MTDLDHGLVRKLAEWAPTGAPITSVYLTVDGRRYPRKSDYELRLGELLRRARTEATSLDRDEVRSVEADLTAMSAFVREEFERGDTRGLALFSANAAGLWEEIRVRRPVRDRAVVGSQADLLPLQHLLETCRSMCVALVDYEKARLLIVEVGRIDEVSDISDEVPGRHDQGGWAQMRMQRHVDDHRQQHLKHVAGSLLRLRDVRAFDHLVLSGSHDVLANLEPLLHDYLRRRVCARIALPIVAPVSEVLTRALEIGDEVERREERERIEALVLAAESGDRGSAGLGATLAALTDGRVGELLVSIDLSVPGAVCPACGRLADHGSTCAACRTRLEPVPDVVEAAVVQAFRQGCRVETVVGRDALARVGGIGALLRF
jgi:peptide chain release factor subunit 1